jgi:3-oxoacyl-[acyl-carrier-protein] synthase III
MSQSKAHIAGIGFSSGTRQDISNLAVSAGAKALLDAGITYAKVRLSIACSLEEAGLSVPQACFKAFGRQKAPICAVDSQSALFTAAQCVRSGQIDCVMVVGLDMVSYFASQSPPLLIRRAGTREQVWQANKGRTMSRHS